MRDYLRIEMENNRFEVTTLLKINSEELFTDFTIDTGATSTILSASYIYPIESIRKLHQEKDENDEDIEKVTGVGLIDSPVRLYKYSFDEIILDNYNIGSHPIYICYECAEKIALLGMDILSKMTSLIVNDKTVDNTVFIAALQEDFTGGKFLHELLLKERFIENINTVDVKTF